MKTMRQAMLLFLLFSLEANASNVDPQIRTLFHLQETFANGKIGVAAWGVDPNVLATDTPRGLTVAGLLYRENARNWIEFLGGAFLDGEIDPTFDMRAIRLFEPIDIKLQGGLEAIYAIRKDKLVLSPVLSLPFNMPVVNLPTQAGIEADLIFLRGDFTFGAGPRLGISPFPFLTIVLAAQSDSSGNFILRQYWTFSLSK